MLETKAKLGAKAIGRGALENTEGYELKNPQSPYKETSADIGFSGNEGWEIALEA